MAMTNSAFEDEENDKLFLTKAQVSDFIENGILVVENVLNAEQIKDARLGLARTLQHHGVDTNDLERTGYALQKLSSTNGSGGVLDIFYPGWKMDIATNPRLFHVTCQLWEAAYCHDGETRDDLKDHDKAFKWHPYGAFDPNEGYAYIDRIGYRLPTEMAQRIAHSVDENTNKSKIKPIQRCLTPHLDCCPENFFSGKTKWRPIQCFVSLTDNLEKNTGGFEAAPKFHREFDTWAESRQPTRITKRGETISFPPPCVGEYTHIRPVEDREVMNRIQHVAVRAGSAVLWDNRIPHANAYRNDGMHPRSVVYCSFLPNVQLNREYVGNQLLKWKRRQPPTDQWTKLDTDNPLSKESPEDVQYEFSKLGRRLIGLDPW